MHFIFKKKIVFVIAGIVGFALVLRALPLRVSAPFWIDEFSSASQAQLLLKHGLGVFSLKQSYFEYHNITTHTLITLSFALFGMHEWAARLPMVIIGAAVPAATYLLCIRLTKNAYASVSSALLVATSYFMITWSVQARGYPIQQILTLTILSSYILLIQNSRHSVRHLVVLAILAFLGILTHVSLLILIGTLSCHYALTHKRTRRVQLLLGTISLMMTAILIGSGLVLALRQSLETGAFGANNVWYYHSFLWREYGVETFLAGIGAIFMWQKYPQSRILHIFMTVYLLFFLFFYKPYNTRYLLAIFPLLFIMMSVAIAQIARLLTTKKRSGWVALIITFAIIAQGNLFVIKPKRFYSVNHSFREIALIDYDQVYRIIQEKSSTKASETAVIDTWWDRARWYLGAQYKPLYAFRWDHESGRINGLSKSTPYTTNANGEKVIYKSDNVKLVSNLPDLLRVMKKYPQGFIFIDDTSMSKEVITFAQQNFYHELHLDHYIYDDNPSSIWPADLYSWGFKKNEYK